MWSRRDFLIRNAFIAALPLFAKKRLAARTLRAATETRLHAARIDIDDPLGLRRVLAQLDSLLVSRWARVARLVRASFRGVRARPLAAAVSDGSPLALDLLDLEKALAQLEGWFDATAIRVVLDTAREIESPPRGHFLVRFSGQAVTIAARQAHARAREIGATLPSGGFDEFLRLVRSDVPAEQIAARQFSLLRDMTLRQGDEIKDLLIQGVRAGDAPRIIGDRIAERVEGVSTARARTIARTELVRGHSRANLAGLRRAGVTAVEALVEFTLNVHGTAEPCPLCIGLAGKIFTLDAAEGIIPVHPNCLPGDALVTASSRITGGSKRWFEGDLIVVHSASGHEFACTPNHPVLTDCGWVAADGLDKEKHSLCRLSTDREFLGAMDNQYVPAMIEEIADALAVAPGMIAVPVPVTAPNFHGDGLEGDIAVVWADRFLRHQAESRHLSGIRSVHFSDQLGQLAFVVADAELKPLAGEGALNLFGERVLSAANSSVSRRGVSRSLVRAHATHAQRLGVAHRSSSDTLLGKSSFDDASADSQFAGDRLLANAGLIQRHDPINGHIEPPSPSLFIPEGIASINVRSFSGHVYNLQTEGGWFAVDDLIISNCQCGWLPARTR